MPYYIHMPILLVPNPPAVGSIALLVGSLFAAQKL